MAAAGDSSSALTRRGPLSGMSGDQSQLVSSRSSMELVRFVGISAII
jgi:hypothetical protein